MLRFPISISIGSGAHGAVAVCTVSYLDDDDEEEASAESWFFLLEERVVVDLALHILRSSCVVASIRRRSVAYRGVGCHSVTLSYEICNYA